MPSTDDDVYLSLDTSITRAPYLPIPIYTDCALTFNAFVCFQLSIRTALHFVPSSLIPFNAFVFLSFTNTSIGTPPPQTHFLNHSPRFVLMRWCPVRNLTNTFPHNRAPTLPKAPQVGFDDDDELPKTIQYCCSRATTIKAVYEGSPQAARNA